MKNIFKTWWKVRKYFKIPNIYIYIGNVYSIPISTYSVDVGYKETDNHKIWVNYNPQMNLSIFGIFQFYMELRKYVEGEEVSNVYWTAILNYLHYGDLKDAMDDALTLVYNEDADIVKKKCLTRKGRKKYESLCNK